MGRTEQGLASMYARLPLGPHQMTREDVARNQRTRLYGAMVEAVSERGYRATTVAHVIGLAGVSRRAFYEQYANKEACFLSTYDILVARSNKLALDAWSKERGWANRVHAAFKAVLDDCVASPKGLHLVLVDALGIGPRAREHMQLTATVQENMIAAAFDSAPDGVKLPPLTAKAIVGGMRHVVFTRLHEGREQELLTMTDELLDWVSAYRSPSGTRLDAIVPREPQDVPSTQAAFLASDDVRARTLQAVVQLTLEGGYAELTDPQIAQWAGTSTEAFHKQFSSKQECFLAVVDELTREALAVVRGRMEDASCWAEAVHMAVAASTEFFVARSTLIRMTLIDLFEVGPAIVDRMASTIECFTKLLDETGPKPNRSPTIAAEAITGAIWAVLSSCAATDRVAYLPYLTDHITFIVLAPYVGAKQAMQTIEEGREKSSKAA
jgi:AcrR family transcriptional regulator